MTESFRDLGVDAALCDALEAKNITHPFPIQMLTLPMALAGNDLIGQARTGTGKTLAFGLPLLQRIDPADRMTQALIVVPTRELCVQVHDDLTIGAARGVTSIAVYGGTPYEEQTAALESGVHVVVGTPGRLIDHLNRGTLDLSRVRALVLDEADEMLDMGFLPDVERLIEACPVERHTMLFSATMPTAIVRMARRYMVSPTFTRADLTEGETAPNVTQHFMQVHRMDKPRLLARLLQSADRGNVYVFVRTKHMADRLVEELGDLGSEAIAIHGDLKQATRERNLDRFRAGKVSVLVATEVAARGLDVENVTHVVNYDCPEDEKMYLHRIGRTARAGHAGVAVTFVEHSEMERANLIRRAIGRTDIEVKETFSTSPELIELFDLPAEVPWARATARRRAPEEGDRDGGRGGRGGRDGGRGGRDGGREGGRDGGSRNGGGRGGRSERADTPRTEDVKKPSGASDVPSGRRPAEPAAQDAPAAPTAPRTRTRARARGAAEPTSGASTPAGGDAAAPTRTRTRPGATDSAERSPARAEERAEGPSDGRSEDAPRRSRGRRGGRGRGRSGRTEDASGQAAAPRETRDDTSSRSSQARDTRPDESAAAPARAERGERSRRGERSSGRTTRTPAPTVAQAAPRGEGQPQLARRVKVEHLP